MFLEVCAFNIQSAIIGQKAGAIRAELCDNPIEGGTTPSYGAIARTREKISIELYPIIRPRAGSYFYDEDEFEMMLRDIRICKDLGCDGISIGVQQKDGTIDAARLKKIVDTAYPMGVTCNRAFDAVPDAFAALETIIDAGCERILTSGLKSAAPDATDFIKQLVDKAAGRIIIMPGAGVNSKNIQKMIDETGATEFHTSGRVKLNDAPSPAYEVDYKNPAILDLGNVYVSSESELSAIVTILNAAKTD
ncbi:MAG: copper homeostasis protein CutC [Chitinophagaceae bacterium]|nr:MAG: copper homeostasis protein CutC [Chitinophagaceae bacterium]